MAETTRFGLTKFGGSLGGSIGDDGGKFSNLDREVIDRLLQALEGHSHSGGFELADPSGVPSLTLSTEIGGLPAGVTVYYRVSYVDEFGLETAGTDEVSVTTPALLAPPTAPALVGVVDPEGVLAPGPYAYAISYYQTSNAETTVSAASALSINTLSNAITLTLPALPPGAAGYRIYRQAPGESDFYLLAQVATTTFVDDGNYLPDKARLVPVENSTNGTNSVSIELPETDLVADVPLEAIKAWRVYRTFTSGAYGSSSLVHEVVETTTEGGTDLVSMYVDDGDPTKDGRPLERSTTFKPPGAVDVGSVTAGAVGFTPTGSLAATNVQAAIAELDSENQRIVKLAFASTLVPASSVVEMRIGGALGRYVLGATESGLVIDGIQAWADQMITAGSLTIEVLVNGVKAGSALLKVTLTSALRKGSYQALTTDRVVLAAADDVVLRITSSADFAPTTDVVASLTLARF